MKCNCCGSKKTIKDNEGNIFCSNCGYYIQKNNEGELCKVCSEREYNNTKTENNNTKHNKRPEINFFAVLLLFFFGLGFFAIIYIIITLSNQKKWDDNNR